MMTLDLNERRARVPAAASFLALWACNTTFSGTGYGAGMRATAGRSATMRPFTTARRAYRLYLSGATTMQEQRHEAVLASDEEARQLAMLMLDEQADYPCAEIWDGARLVCTLRRGE
jgi:hypothetical protein